MKFLIVICAFVLSVQSAPQVVPQFEISENGEYRFGWVESELKIKELLAKMIEFQSE